MKIIVVYHRDKDSSVGVKVPSIPGCYSSAEGTINEAFNNIKEGIVSHLETMVELGMPLPVIPDQGEFSELGKELKAAGETWGLIDVDIEKFYPKQPA